MAKLTIDDPVLREGAASLAIQNILGDVGQFVHTTIQRKLTGNNPPSARYELRMIKEIIADYERVYGKLDPEEK